MPALRSRSINSARTGREPLFDGIVTDSTGAFHFKPTRPGDYYVEVAKPDYVGFAVDSPDPYLTAAIPSTGTLVTLKKDHPSGEVRLALMRLGELRGKSWMTMASRFPGSGLT